MNLTQVDSPSGKSNINSPPKHLTKARGYTIRLPRGINSLTLILLASCHRISSSILENIYIRDKFNKNKYELGGDKEYFEISIRLEASIQCNV